MNWRKYKYIGLGCLSYVPGLHALLRRGTGGTNSARYCYAVWLRHLVHGARHDLTFRGAAIAELGPGDSLGIGLSALLCGADRYVALDAIPHAKSETNLRIFDELVELFRTRTPIPDDVEFPNLHPRLPNYEFPRDILGDDLLAQSLAQDRIAELREDIRRLDGRVRYVPGWFNCDAAEHDSVDLVLSQAVMEHVNDVDAVYRSMHHWLKPGAYMSHQIDLKCHETSATWNGHLQYSRFVWRLMRGRLPYLLNRRAYSEHLQLLHAAGFQVLGVECVHRHDGVTRASLAKQFSHLTDEDLLVSGTFIQACKPANVSLAIPRT